MVNLPIWNVPPTSPALFDLHSATVLEQTARVYDAMRNLISEYNAFAEEANRTISAFSESEKKEREEFETDVTKVMKEFQCSMERYLKVNLEDTAATLINTAIEEGKLLVQKYNPDTEELNIGLIGGV